MPEQNKDVKAPPSESSAGAQTDVKAIESIVDSVMQAHGDAKESSTEAGEEATETATEKAPEGSVPKQNETGEMSEEEVKEEKEEQGAGEKTEEVKEVETETTTAEKHEEAVPYERFKEVNERVKTLEPLAQAQQELGRFCQSNRIANDQLTEALNVAALVNTNPEAALAKFESYVENLRVALGKGLPADLQKDVSEGTISEARAKELAQARLKTQGVESTNRYAQLQQQQFEQQQTLQAMGSWMDNKLRLNPSFKQKASPTAPDGMFEDFLKNNTWLFTQRRPANGQSFTSYELTAMAEEAYNETLKMAQRYMPKPVAKKSPLSSTTSSHKSTTPRDPKSPEDVVEMIARKHKMA